MHIKSALNDDADVYSRLLLLLVCCCCYCMPSIIPLKNTEIERGREQELTETGHTTEIAARQTE